MASKAVARETFFALRDTIARLESENLPGLRRLARQADTTGFGDPQPRNETGRMPLGLPLFDQTIDGGLPMSGLTEIRSAQTRDTGAATGFTLALAALFQNTGKAANARRSAPVLWISETMAGSEAGLPYAVGLQAHGLDIDRLFISRPRTVQDALWIAEAALSTAAFAAVILEVRGNPAIFGLSESRRLHGRARATGLPFLLLRQAGEEEASSAMLRLCVTPAPAALRRLPDGSGLKGSIGNPAFLVAVEKSRALPTAATLIEWSAHDRRFLARTAAAATPAPGIDPAHPVAAFPASGRRQGGAIALGSVLAFPGPT